MNLTWLSMVHPPKSQIKGDKEQSLEVVGWKEALSFLLLGPLDQDLIRTKQTFPW